MPYGYFRPPIRVLMSVLTKKLAIFRSDGMGMNINTFQCRDIDRRHDG
jgi:hypothetical protein